MWLGPWQRQDIFLYYSMLGLAVGSILLSVQLVQGAASQMQNWPGLETYNTPSRQTQGLHLHPTINILVINGIINDQFAYFISAS
jgi:hypothetical protein